MLALEQKPMLAKLVRELPEGDVLYERKGEGFRCLAFREHDDVDLRSRHGRPLGRYLPELTRALAALPEPCFALDGEVLVLKPPAPPGEVRPLATGPRAALVPARAARRAACRPAQVLGA